ncbi:fimbrial protein [Providencia hangzhouensis]|uniref:fimbrial protein n=1 Tax=Providencia hangzhouensis TaxID=3031799 RepID=UPI0034DD6C5B
MKYLTFNKLLSLSLSICTLIDISPANALGSVKMSGSIIETACAIDVGSRDQTINMGSLSLSDIRRDGQGPAHPFVIKLVNCVLERQNPNKPNWQYFRVTFDGAHQRGLFSVNGQANGVGLQIKRNDDGAIIVPGQALSAQTLTQGSHDLAYELRLVANHAPLVSGQYYSQLRFKLDYE